MSTQSIFEKAIAEGTVGSIPLVRTAGPVERFLDQFAKVQFNTCRDLLELAEWMEGQAIELRNAAAHLNQQGKQLPEDIRNATQYEISWHTRMIELSTIRPAPTPK